MLYIANGGPIQLGMRPNIRYLSRWCTDETPYDGLMKDWILPMLGTAGKALCKRDLKTYRNRWACMYNPGVSEFFFEICVQKVLFSGTPWGPDGT